MIKAAIIDDEIQSIDVLNRMLSALHCDIEVVAVAHNVKDGIALLNKHEIDLLFLDIEMPDGTGFDLLDALGDVPFDVIFITAFNQYAIKAFRYAALDYLMKPIMPTELEDALNRVRDFSTKVKNDRIGVLLENHKGEDKFKKLAVSTAEGVFYFEIENLVRCQAEGSYTFIFAIERKPLLASKSIKEYESILPENFYRVHKSHLVNFKYVKKLESGDQPRLILKDESFVTVSRRRKQYVQDKLSSI